MYTFIKYFPITANQYYILFHAKNTQLPHGIGEILFIYSILQLQEYYVLVGKDRYEFKLEMKKGGFSFALRKIKIRGKKRKY